MNMRGKTTLYADDHDLWACVKNRLDAKLSWEEIAAEIGCDCDDLVYWVNFVYVEKKKPTVRMPSRPKNEPPKRLEAYNYDNELPVNSPQRKSQSQQFLAWKRARDAAAKQREAINA